MVECLVESMEGAYGSKLDAISKFLDFLFVWKTFPGKFLSKNDKNLAFLENSSLFDETKFLFIVTNEMSKLAGKLYPKNHKEKLLGERQLLLCFKGHLWSDRGYCPKIHLL